MDSKHFDHLSRILGAGASRRGLVGVVAAAMGLRQGTLRAKRPDDKPDPKVMICHKPGKSGGSTLCVSRSAVPAHLRHGDYLGECCPKDHARCQGGCCPPPPQGGKARCCRDGSCGCAGECCADHCFLDDFGAPEPVREYCCTAPKFEVCEMDDKADTCCPAGDNCRCIEGGIAGSYRRPGR